MLCAIVKSQIDGNGPVSTILPTRLPELIRFGNQNPAGMVLSTCVLHLGPYSGLLRLVPPLVFQSIFFSLPLCLCSLFLVSPSSNSIPRPHPAAASSWADRTPHTKEEVEEEEEEKATRRKRQRASSSSIGGTGYPLPDPCRDRGRSEARKTASRFNHPNSCAPKIAAVL